MSSGVLALLLATLVFVLYLLAERIRLDRRIATIPLRIAVTGTRGKSSVVRLLASILRADGRVVLAKTTGTEARYLLPDGSETDVVRRGVPSIVEQKKLVRKASDLGAECLVAEIMSIHPENHRVESCRFLRPHIVVLTNVRRDHTDAMGETEDEIASVLAAAFSPGAKVFLPENENRQPFDCSARGIGAEIVPVARGGFDREAPRAGHPQATAVADGGGANFEDNLELAWAVGRHLAIADEVIATGIRDATVDAGAVSVWRFRSDVEGKSYYLVNGFAANDPQSTLQLVAKVRESLPGCPERFAALLALRSDRGDRTWQWIHALRAGELDCLDPLFVTGAHAHAMRRKVPELRVLSEARPEQMMTSLLTDVEDGTVILGCGNYVGIGQILVDHWGRTGTRHGL